MHRIPRPFGEAKPTTGSSREKDIKLLLQQLQEKDNIILAKNNELAEISKRIRDHQNDDRKLKEIDNKWKEFQTFMQTAMDTKLGIEHRSLIIKYNNLLDMNQNIKEMLKNTENDLAESLARQSLTQDSLRDAQASAFRFQDQPQWAPDSDDAIRQQLKSLEKEAKAWCGANSIKALSILGAMPANLPGEWKDVLRYDVKIFARNDQHLPQLILQALLMDYIYGEIFAKPFFFLPWRVQGPGEEGGTSMTARRDQYELMAGILQEIAHGM